MSTPIDLPATSKSKNPCPVCGGHEFVSYAASKLHCGPLYPERNWNNMARVTPMVDVEYVCESTDEFSVDFCVKCETGFTA
jgi:hypothetical protein